MRTIGFRSKSITKFWLRKGNNSGEIHEWNKYKHTSGTEYDESEKEQLTTHALVHELNSTKGDGLEDGRLTKAYFNRLKMIEYGCLIMSLMGISLSIIQYDLEFNESDSQYSYIMLWIIFASNILLSFMIIIRYLFSLQYAKTKRIVPEQETLISSGQWKELLLEIIICLFGPFPQLQGIRFYFYTLYDKVHIYMHVNEILSIFIFFRIYMVLRVFLLNSRYNSNRSQRICEMYGCESGYLFTVKCLMKEKPLKFIFSALLLSIPYFAYIIRICENPISRVPNAIHWNFDNFLNCMWHVIVTIGTIGYGDYFVRTALGRAIIFVASMWGIFVVSIMVVSLTNALDMNPLELKAFTLFQRLKLKNKMKKEAAIIISSLVKVKLMSRKSTKKLSSQTFLPKLRDHMKKFRKLARLYKEAAGETQGFEEMIRQFEFLRDEIKDLRKQEKYLMESNKLLMLLTGVDAAVVGKLESILKESNIVKKRRTISNVAQLANSSLMRAAEEISDTSQDLDITKQTPY